MTALSLWSGSLLGTRLKGPFPATLKVFKSKQTFVRLSRMRCCRKNKGGSAVTQTNPKWRTKHRAAFVPHTTAYYAVIGFGINKEKRKHCINVGLFGLALVLAVQLSDDLHLATFRLLNEIPGMVGIL